MRAGPILAATDEIRIHVRGKGGHAAMPHLAVDPVVVTAHIITALQTIASRNVSPLDAIVVSLCSMETSQLGAFNVIPDAVKLIGTVRTFRAETQELAEQRIREIAAGVAQGLGAQRRGRIHPRLSRHRQHAAGGRVRRTTSASAIFGTDNVVREFDPTMGGEDFSYMLQVRPGAYRPARAGRRRRAAATCTTPTTISTTR